MHDNAVSPTGCLHDSQIKQLKSPTAFSKIYKEECTYCFVTPEDDHGLNVCLTCFQGGCSTTHSMLHYRKSGHCLALNVKQRRIYDSKDGSPTSPKLLKIEVKSSIEPQMDSLYEIYCLACTSSWRLDSSDTPKELNTSANSVIKTMSASHSIKAQAWQEEVTTCQHSTNLHQTILDPLASQLQNREQCSQCSLRENLWMCLTCGSVGCGRQQFDGSGGNGHGAEHHSQHHHPLAVKLGTITPTGQGDVHCYECNEMRLDPQLNQHLLALGLDVGVMEKTEQTMAELQLEQNQKFDFSMVTDDGHQLEPVSGAGRIGLKNLGNSCYINSVLQSVLHLETFERHYTSPTIIENHFKSCHRDTPSCFICQMAKVGTALFAEKSTVIAPWMLKAVLTNGHPEFSTSRQQDAAEFFAYFLKIIQRNDPSASADLVEPFSFQLVQKLCCPMCNDTRYQQHTATQLSLQIGDILVASPHDNLTLSDIPSLEFFLGKYFEGELVEGARCPNCHHQGRVKSFSLSSMPQYLVITLSRYILKNWVPQKLEMSVHVPFNQLDVKDFIASPQMVEASGNVVAVEGDNQPNVDEVALAELMSMGFPEKKCRSALIETNNSGLESAMNWIFEHGDEIKDEASSSAVADSDITMLMEAGFTREQAIQGLEATDGNLERAFDWILNHPREDSIPSGSSSNVPDASSNNTAYRLVSFISHKGPSVHCGHYIAHVRDSNDGKWLMFNDERVVIAKPQPPQAAADQGYIFVYERNPQS